MQHFRLENLFFDVTKRLKERIESLYFLFLTYLFFRIQLQVPTTTLSTTTIATPATTERMADQWAKEFKQMGITDDESILNERWADLGLDPFLLKSINDREDELLKKIEVVI